MEIVGEVIFVQRSLAMMGRQGLVLQSVLVDSKLSKRLLLKIIIGNFLMIELRGYQRLQSQERVTQFYMLMTEKDYLGIFIN